MVHGSIARFVPGAGAEPGSQRRSAGAFDDPIRFDEQLARLGRFEARARLALGERLDALFTHGGHHELGFSSEQAYVLERCGQKVRWARQTRGLARRLKARALYRIRAAIFEGRISFGMAELLARHATIEDEAELLAAAEGKTLRQMRKVLSPDTGGDAEVDDASSNPAQVSIRRVVGPSELLMVHASRPLVEMVTESYVSDEALLNALLGETESALLALEERRSDGGRCFDEGAELSSTTLHRLESAFAHAEGDPELDRAPTTASRLAPIQEPPPLQDVHALDAEIVRASAALAERHLEMGRLARWMLVRGWFELGYASRAEYARERVGVSLSTLEHRVTLARRVDTHPEIEEALVGGVIGSESAMLIGLVLDRARSREPGLARAWVERAARRTVIHLREEVNAVLISRDLDAQCSVAPPDHEALEEVAELERQVQTGELYASLLGSRYRSPQMFVTLRAGRGRELCLRVSEELGRHMLEVEKRFKKYAGPGASFVAFMCFSLWQAWLPYLQAYEDKWKHIYVRDRHRCMNPTCDRHDVTPHHLRFQSQGGGHEDENLASLCSWCHLFGIHEGRLKAAPPASNIRWLIGRIPILEVLGREKRQIERGAWAA